MQDPLTEQELAELEQEIRRMSQWALDEADVRRLSLHRRALEELRHLRAEIVERRAAELSMRQHVENVEAQLEQARQRGAL